jgi:hypothetical protein
MFFKETQILLLKCLGPVMFLLSLDISDNFRDLRFADRKGPISILPGEIPHLGKRFMDPFG